MPALREKRVVVYDAHPESPRVMYEWRGGQYTFEQWQLIVFMTKLDEKLDRVLADQQMRP